MKILPNKNGDRNFISDQIFVESKALYKYLRYIGKNKIEPINFIPKVKKAKNGNFYEESHSVFINCKNTRDKIKEFYDNVFPCYSPAFKNKLIENGITPFCKENNKASVNFKTGIREKKTCWYFIKDEKFKKVRLEWQNNRK